MKKLLCLVIDAHGKHCVPGNMNNRGEFLRTWTFVTWERELIWHVEALDACKKILAIEEGSLAFCIAHSLKLR